MRTMLAGKGKNDSKESNHSDGDLVLKGDPMPRLTTHG